MNNVRREEKIVEPISAEDLWKFLVGSKDGVKGILKIDFDSLPLWKRLLPPKGKIIHFLQFLLITFLGEILINKRQKNSLN